MSWIDWITPVDLPEDWSQEAENRLSDTVGSGDWWFGDESFFGSLGIESISTDGISFYPRGDNKIDPPAPMGNNLFFLGILVLGFIWIIKK